MSIKRNKNRLIISILVGVTIFAVTYQFIVKLHDENVKQRTEIEKLKSGVGINPSAVQENTTIYVVAKKEIKKGEIIKAEDVETKDIGMQIKGAITSIDKVVGKPALKTVKEGAPFTKGSVNIPKDNVSGSNGPRSGFRAVAATMSAGKITPFMKDNAYIDIYTANNSIQAKNVRIIRIIGQEGKSRTVLFEIGDDDVGAFIHAITKDKLIPVQRNIYDKSGYQFSFDPFKYSGYTISNEDLNGLSEVDDVPKAQESIPVPKSPKKGAKKKIESEDNSSVEVIMGNTIKVMDF